MKTPIKFALAGAMALSVATFAFQPDMTTAQIEQEIAERLKKNEGVQTIASLTQQTGVAPSVMIASLVNLGVPTSDVVCGTIAAGIPYGTVISAAVASGANPAAIASAATACGVTEENAIQALIVAGVDPTLFAEATAAGPGKINQANRGNPVIPSGPFTGVSPIPTFGGGGGGGASPS